ncbi:basic salivary proline-rich protein 3-like [Equus asinus]|uniref:basic salivary proline-rich protein 3-like n=1 Tax=Equus asinus TaxID=9793 RepID=UPI0038F66C15
MSPQRSLLSKPLGSPNPRSQPISGPDTPPPPRRCHSFTSRPDPQGAPLRPGSPSSPTPGRPHLLTLSTPSPLCPPPPPAPAPARRSRPGGAVVARGAPAVPGPGQPGGDAAPAGGAREAEGRRRRGRRHGAAAAAAAASEGSPAAGLGPAALSAPFLEGSPPGAGEPCDASAGRPAEPLLREISPCCLPTLPSRLPPRRPSGSRDASSEFPGLVPGAGSQLPLSPFGRRAGPRPRPRRGRTPSRPSPRRLPPAPSSHPTLSGPRHLTPPASPGAPRAPRPGPASRSSPPETAHLPALRPREEETFPGALSSPSLPPHSPCPPPALSVLGEGGCRLGLKAIDLYVFVPAPEAAPAARAGAAAAAAARGVASPLP